MGYSRKKLNQKWGAELRIYLFYFSEEKTLEFLEIFQHLNAVEIKIPLQLLDIRRSKNKDPWKFHISFS